MISTSTRVVIVALSVAAARACATDEIIIGGRVADLKTGTAIPGAQIILVAGDAVPQVTYSNPSGLYTLQVRAGTQLDGVGLIASAPAYHRFTKVFSLPTSGGQSDFLLNPVTPDRAGARADSNSTNLVPGGLGSNWSNWYRLCSKPLRPQERIGSDVKFELQGDRR